ncbi:unnamed protein product [Ambrosiozyma monospora]|uniref:Unnamed protein product n=1 Tax=Ambrosiozyma monospora TaxID=43982 RepID=A0ACB5T6V1_AMBMO|nr:unnamed protein product [Ambrosiozyma monospora]
MKLLSNLISLSVDIITPIPQDFVDLLPPCLQKVDWSYTDKQNVLLADFSFLENLELLLLKNKVAKRNLKKKNATIDLSKFPPNLSTLNLLSLYPRSFESELPSSLNFLSVNLQDLNITGFRNFKNILKTQKKLTSLILAVNNECLDFTNFAFGKIERVMLHIAPEPLPKSIVKLIDVPPSLRKFELLSTGKIILSVPEKTQNMTNCGLFNSDFITYVVDASKSRKSSRAG